MEILVSAAGGGGGSGSNASVGPNGSSDTGNSTEIGFIDGSGNLQPLTGTQALGPKVQVSNLPTTQTVSGSVSVSNFPATQAVSGSVSVSNQPTTIAVTQATGTNLHATIDNFPASQAVTGTFWQATQPVSGTFFQATQPVSGTFWQATQPISAASLPLPTGAALDTSVTTMSAKLPASLGAKTTAASLSVTLASDQVGLKQAGTAIANAPVYNAYTTTSVTTSAYVQLIASTTAAASTVDIFDSSGQAMILAVGASGSEVVQYYVQPGGQLFKLAIPAASRVSVKALTGNATSGFLTLNLLA